MMDRLIPALLIGLMLAAAAASVAQPASEPRRGDSVVNDPTKPLGQLTPPRQSKLQALRLSAIFIRDNKSVAIINNRTLTEGDSIQGQRVLRIEAHKVLLAGERSRTLRLYPDIGLKALPED